MLSISYKNKGFTFIEVLVGVALILLVFLAIFGLLQLSLKIAGQSKARITAIALANQRIEIVKNLPYNQVGTISGIPSGIIPETEIITRNNIEYTVKNTIGYVDDPFDGLVGDDLQSNDYKNVKVKVSWPGFLGGQVILITDIVPKGLEAPEGTGNLLISVFNALGIGIGQADIHIVNDSVTPPIDVYYQTNNQGQYLVAGAPSSTAAYQIIVTKVTGTGEPDYSTDRTYGSEEVANPAKPHTTVIEGSLTEISFSIDQLSSFLIKTLSPWGSDSFADSFLDESKISEFANVKIKQGEANLATTTDGYVSSGYLLSIPISPGNIINWDKFSWTDNQPLETDIKYQVFYASGTSWLLIPDNDLTNNSVGFNSSPVDLAGLATTTYPQLKVKGNLSTNNTSTSPTLFDWSISWLTGQPTPIGNVSFNLQGNKIIGTDFDEEPVYKYSTDFTTNSAGQLDILDLEWDAYDFTIDPAENLDLVSTEPASVPLGQKIDLLPKTNQLVSLFLEAENSLLVTLHDSETLEDIFSAQIRLFSSGLGYDQTQFTDEQGQTLFIPLETGNYNIEIQADGYESYLGTVSVFGDKTVTINLTPTGPS